MPWLVIVTAIMFIGIDSAYSQSVKTTYLCPQNFHPIGKKCYHFSTEEAIWTDAHFHCQMLNSTLSSINSYREQNQLKDFFSCSNDTKLEKTERWIDGIYDWKQQKWKWGSSGKVINFNAFSRNHMGDEYKWKCIALNGAKRNKWISRKCTEKKQFICETETNVIVQFKLYKKKFDLSKCSSGEMLEKYERKKCLKLLGATSNNGPENYVQKPKRKKGSKRRNVDDWICPPNMISLGNKCYSFSETEMNWPNAHFECRKNHSKLAIVRSRSQEHNLRRFLNNFIEKHDRWIGGIFDWKSGKWRWAMTGQPITYKDFIMDVKRRSVKDLEWNSIFMDPKYDNQWNADKQTNKKRFICQVNAKSVKKLGSAKTKPAQAVVKILV